MSLVRRVPRLTRAEFVSGFLRAGPPVIITDALNDWAGPGPWTSDALRQRWGDRSVSAFVTPDGEWSYTCERQTVSFADLIDATLTTGPHGPRISGPQLDLARDIPWAASDMQAPAFVPAERIVASNLWLQANGDKTHLHWDEDPGVLGLLRGEKEIVLYAPGDWRALYPNHDGAIAANWSRVDVWKWDAAAFPRFQDAQPIRLTLRAGEMLFVPQTWWHCVRTVQPSIAINCWWTEPAAEVGDVYRNLLAFGNVVSRGGTAAPDPR